MYSATKKLWGDLSSPKAGLEYANRFSVFVFLITMAIDIILLLFNYLNGEVDVGVIIYNNDLKKDQFQYMVILVVLFIGGIVWSVNCKLDERLHTLLIFGIMVTVIQMLFLCIGIKAFAANYVLIFVSIIYSRPLLTFLLSVIVFLMSSVNYYTMVWLTEHEDLHDLTVSLSKETWNYFQDSIFFFLPMIVIVAVLISFCLRQLFRYNREYANAKTLMETNNKAAALIQEQILSSSRIDETAKENVSVYPFLKTADYVAGDFYDYYNIDRYHVCFLIADVSGKGIAAGLYMVRAKEVLKITAKDHFNPADALSRANKLLCDGNDECMFATAWLGILDLRTGVVSYSNAGHTSPVFMSNGRVVTLNEVSGPMLGLYDDIEYASHLVKLVEGDRIILYTDGVTEQPIDDKNRYDEKGLLDFVKANYDKDNLCEAIYEDIEKYDKKQFDDITMLQLNLDRLKSNTSKLNKEINRNCCLAATPKSIGTIRKMIFDELNDAKVDKDVINTFYVACEEMVTNIIKYAYGSTDNNGGFELSLMAQDNFIAITLKDTGVAFNPFLYDNSVYANKASGITEGGRGIKIFTEIMDEYTYERKSDTNIVTARKYI